MNEETLRLLRQILKGGKLTEARIDSLLGSFGLSATKLLTLRHLDQAHESVSLGALAQCMAFAKSNATQLVDHLESSGLVERVPSPNDRRCTELALTGLGKKQMEAGSQAIRPLAERIESLFSPRERAQLLVYLERLSEALS